MSYAWTSTGIYTARLTTYFIVFLKFFLKFDRTHITTIVTTIEKAKAESDENVTFTVLLHARTETLGHLATVDS